MSKPAPAPYETVDVGNGTNGFHTYLIDCNKRKIGVAWGPKEEKVWTAALWAAAPDLLAAGKLVLESAQSISVEQTEALEAMKAAVAKATGATE